MSRLRFLFDEDFNGHIVRGFRRRQPQPDTRTVREVGLEGADDPIVLTWAAENRRLVVSHDRRTMTAAARRRIRNRLPMTGRCDCFSPALKTDVGPFLESAPAVLPTSEVQAGDLVDVV